MDLYINDECSFSRMNITVLLFIVFNFSKRKWTCLEDHVFHESPQKAEAHTALKGLFVVKVDF